MSIKFTKDILYPKYQSLDELKEELIDNLDVLKKSFPGFTYTIENKKDYLIIKSLNLKEYVN